MKNRKNLMSKIGACLLGLGGLFGLAYSTANYKLKPLGWGDVNGNGTKDAIVGIPFSEQLPPGTLLDILGFIDGQDISKYSNGSLTARRRAFHQFYLPENAIHQGSPYILLPQETLDGKLLPKQREGIETAVIVERSKWKDSNLVNLDLYTTVDVEPGCGKTTYEAVAWR